jgi:hypothetical protein
LTDTPHLTIVTERKAGGKRWFIEYLLLRGLGVTTGVWRKFLNLPNPTFNPQIHTDEHRSKLEKYL